MTFLKCQAQLWRNNVVIQVKTVHRLLLKREKKRALSFYFLQKADHKAKSAFICFAAVKASQTACLHI